jgi:hypothetical protein
MDNKFYTYAYLRKDGTPYYIGKGKGRRCYDRRGRAGCKTPQDRSRIIFLKQNLTEEEAFRHEVYMIAVLGRKDLGTGILRNLTDGGDGSSGLRHTQETRERIRKSNLGRKHTEEAKEKISKIHKGKKLSQEQIELMRRNSTGKRHTEEAKEKCRLAKLGNQWNVGKKGELHACSKRVEVSYPDGAIKIFPSLQSVAEAFHHDKGNLAKFVRRSLPPKSGKFEGYSFRYL